MKRALIAVFVLLFSLPVGGLSMKRRFIGLFVALFSLPVFAQTVANGPYYATPSWDQTLPVAQRFIVLSNFNQEAVLDRETGLVWERNPGVPSHFNLIWVSAVGLCPQTITGGREGWRLPTLHELQSLRDPTRPIGSGLALPVGHPFLGIAAVNYWVATTLTDFPQFAFTVSMEAGAGITSIQKSTANRAWCVRGGGPITQY
jgi:hypothetical protein